MKCSSSPQRERYTRAVLRSPCVLSLIALVHLALAAGVQAQLNNGPDLVAGDLNGPAQFGSNGTLVGLAVGPTECNAGNVEVKAFGMPETDHAVIAQNLYRMSGGPANKERFEQIGQSWAKHRAGAEQVNHCNYGCIPAADTTRLGAGCSDTYDAGFGAAYSTLGSRAWVNPFTGNFSSAALDHTGHVHNGTSHRLAVERSDLQSTNNASATYYFELQYISPHEYAWCAAHPVECNMYNNVSYRQYSVTGSASFAFAPLGNISVTEPALFAWPGAHLELLEPAPGVDGIAYVAWIVTGPVNGLWHYEYAVYNENLDRAIQAFTVPLGCGITVSNPGFHAPTNDPGSANDGTLGDAGFSNAPWTRSQTPTALTWNTEAFAQNPNANAVRWGTLYNFRFDADRPPQTTRATVGFLKTGAPVTVTVGAPMPDICAALQMTSAVSRKAHGSDGTFDLNLPASGALGIDSREGQGAHQLVFRFNNPVASGRAAIVAGSATLAGAPSFAGDNLIVNLTGVADAQIITVALSDVTDAYGQTMPETMRSVGFLVGDSNGDGFVNASDALQTRIRSGQAVDNSNARVDINLDGSINTADALLVRTRSGNSVP